MNPRYHLTKGETTEWDVDKNKISIIQCPQVVKNIYTLKKTSSEEKDTAHSKRECQERLELGKRGCGRGWADFGSSEVRWGWAAPEFKVSEVCVDGLWGCPWIIITSEECSMEWGLESRSIGCYWWGECDKGDGYGRRSREGGENENAKKDMI